MAAGTDRRLTRAASGDAAVIDPLILVACAFFLLAIGALVGFLEGHSAGWDQGYDKGWHDSTSANLKSRLGR